MLDKWKAAEGAPDHAVRNKRGTEARPASVAEGVRRVVTKGERIVRVVDTAPAAKKVSSEQVAEKLGATLVGNAPKK